MQFDVEEERYTNDFTLNDKGKERIKNIHDIFSYCDECKSSHGPRGCIFGGALICLNCHKHGHTIKNCPLLFVNK